jgi:putative AdoMet-dependent methyltransferase
MGDIEASWEFDRWAPSYDSSIASSQTYYARYDDVLNYVAETAGSSPGKRILDIGAGTGNLDLRCMQRGACVIALDPSTGMLEQARAKSAGKTNVEFIAADEPFLRIPFNDLSFDAVVSTYAFHHIRDEIKPACIREMIRVLKPGGMFVLGDLIFQNTESKAQALREYNWLEDECFALIEQLQAVFAEFGFKLDCRQFTPHTWVVSTRKAE